jgi:hypothetical protein
MSATTRSGPALGGLSAGTRESLVGAALEDNFAYRGGRLVAERSGARVRSFRVEGREPARPSPSAGAEHFTLPRAYGRVREVNVYLGWFGPLARAMQAGTLAGSVATRVPGVRDLLRAAGERAAGLLTGPDAGTTPGGRSWVAASAYDASGLPLSEVHLAGVDGYDFTAGFLAWAARRAASAGVDGAGAIGPVDGFGSPRSSRAARRRG